MEGTYYVNDDREEYCTLPDPTRTQQLAMIGYLLVQAPLDGTGYTSWLDPDDELIADKMIEYIRDERCREGELFEKYVREQPDYIVNKFERETFERIFDDYSKLEDYREFCAREALSTYRDENGQWKKRQVARVVSAGLDFQDVFEYYGRWAGNDVRLIVAPDSDELAGYEEITDGLTHEMNQTLPDTFIEDGEYVLTPDMVVTSSDGGGDGEDADTNDSGDSEKTLFPVE